jgi:hypothetical protein
MGAFVETSGILILLGFATDAWSQTDSVWKAAAKRLAEDGTKHLMKKVEGDPDSVAGVERVKEWALKEEQLERVAKDLKKKLNGEQSKLKDYRTKILKGIDDYDTEKLKTLLKKPEVESLPCPPFWWNCDD